MPEYGTWYPYTGTEAVIPGIVLLAIAGLPAWLGTRLSRYTMYSLAAMFFVFAVWAFFGFGYPSDPLLIAFNGVSKILAFIAAITLFVEMKRADPL